MIKGILRNTLLFISFYMKHYIFDRVCMCQNRIIKMLNSICMYSIIYDTFFFSIILLYSKYLFGIGLTFCSYPLRLYNLICCSLAYQNCIYLQLPWQIRFYMARSNIQPFSICFQLCPEKKKKCLIIAISDI